MALLVPFWHFCLHFWGFFSIFLVLLHFFGTFWHISCHLPPVTNVNSHSPRSSPANSCIIHSRSKSQTYPPYPKLFSSKCRLIIAIGRLTRSLQDTWKWVFVMAQTDRHPSGSTLWIVDWICLEANSVKIKYRIDAVVLKHINADASNNSNKGCQTILHARMVSEVFASKQLEKKKTIKKSFMWDTCTHWISRHVRIVVAFSLTVLHFFLLFSALFGNVCALRRFLHLLTLLVTFWHFLAKKKCHL